MKALMTLALALSTVMSLSSDAWACPRGKVIHYRSSTSSPQLYAARSVSTVSHTNLQAQEPSDDLLRLPVGSVQELEGNFFGQQTGFITVYANGLTFQAVVTDWSENLIGFEVPNVGTERPTVARIDVILADGRVADSLQVVLVRRTPIRPRVAQPQPAAQAPAESNSAEFSAPRQADTHGVILKRS